MSRLLTTDYVITQRAWQTNVVTGTYHKGIDIAPTGGKESYVKAHTQGQVIAVVNNHNTTDKTGNSYGNYVKIKHPNGYYTLYAHLAPNSIKVSVGMNVLEGEIIATCGMTGRATGVHLHFEVFDPANEKINPNDYIEANLPEIITNVTVNDVIESELSVGDTVLVLHGFLTSGSDGSGTHTAVYDGDINPSDNSNVKVISIINEGASRPYHLRRTNEQGATPMGWASRDQIRKL